MKLNTLNTYYYNTTRHIRPGKIRWMVYHGPKRRAAANMASHDIVLTTYDTLQSEWSRQGPLVEQEWERIILDEGK